MANRSLRQFTSLFLLLLLVLAACRREEAQPTVTPTETAESQAPVEPTPTTGEPTVTAEPEAEPISFDWPPQLVYSSPAPGQETMLDGAITLRFDQAMDQESVAEAFQITQAEANQEVAGTLQWPRADTMIFTPLDQFERSQQYQVTVSDTAVAQNGKPLRQEINLQVETVGFLRVSQTAPTDGAVDIQTDAAITIAFNRPVVPLVTTGQQENLPQPLSFQPQIDGQGSWISTSIYRFVPSQPLSGATTYQVTVDSGLEDVTGGILGDPATFSFTTLRPRVISTTPGNRDRLVAPVGPYEVAFNMPMDRSLTEAAISLSPAAILDYEWADDNRSVTLTPQNPLDRGQEYTLNIATGATSAGGRASLEREVTVPFTVAPLPAVLSTDPADGAEAHRFQFGFTMRFSAPMDPDTIENQLQITPAPDDVDFNFFEDTDGFVVNAGLELERDTRYSVTVPATAADIWGQTMDEAYSWSFTTPPPDPLISFNLPNQPAISQLSTSLPSDVQIVYRNVSQIDVVLRDVGLPVGQLMRFYSGSPDDAGPSGPILNEWSLEVEPSSNEAQVTTLALADGGTLPPGVYYLRAGGPRMPQEVSWWQNQNNYLIVADTNLIVKQTPGNVHVWATNLASGQPAPDLNVRLFSAQGRVLDESSTNEDGLASFEYEPAEPYMESVMVVANEPQQAGFGLASSGWNHRIQPWNFGIQENTSQEPDQFIYLYTDRPIYRPGDTVHFKGILRDTNYGRYPLPTDETVNLQMMFLNEYSEVDFNFSATVDENGEFSGEYEIPDDAALGNYQLFYSSDDNFAERTFAVAEYRAPEFQVAVTATENDLLRGQAGEAIVEATYFFGGSASDLPVNWTVFADDYSLPWDGPYYAFGDNADFFYEPPSLYNFGGGSSFGENILSGSGVTDANGRLSIELPADMLADRDPGSVRITVQADVMDISSFPITGRAEVIFHAAESYVGVRADDNITIAGSETAVELLTVDWDAEPVPNAEVEVIFYQRDWDPVRDTQFGMYYTRWEATDTEVARLSVTTDARGEGEAAFVPDSGGSYIAVATVTDDRGNQQTSSTPLWVMDDAFTGWRSDPREKRMDLVTDQRAYKPGDVARILVQSPFEGPVQAWLTIERGEVIEQRIITLPTGSDVVELPISRNFAPNAFVSVAVVKGIDEGNPYADMRLGVTELEVSPAHLGLNLSLTPQDDLLSPGDTAVYDILITDSDGQPVQANFSLALVDLAVLSLLPDNAPDIHEAFYSHQPMRSLTGSGLIQSGEGLEIEIPQEAPGLGGGGGDGEALAAPALEEEDDETRRDFPDTAFWQAKLATDSEGRATVEISLPDTLTTWRLSSKAVSDYAATQETLVGQSSIDLVSTLPLLVRPVTPRFFVVDDRLEVGAIVHNNTGALQEVTVSLEAAGLTLEDSAETSISLADGQRQLVRWTARVDDVRSVDMTFRAEAGEYRDATKPTFGMPPDQLVPVVRYAGEDFVGTAGALEESGRTVEAILLPETVDERQGEVQVQLSPSLAAALVEALQATDYLADDRSICAPAVADQLLPNVATAAALGALDISEAALQNELDRLIATDIGRLDSLQLRSGGWGWCYSSKVDPFLTAYVTLALVKADQAGYEVPADMVRRGSQSVTRFLEAPEDIASRSDANAQAFYLYVLAEAGAAETEALETLFEEHRALLDPYAKGLLVLAYELTGARQANQDALLSDLNDAVIISATGSHWEDAEPDWNNLSSDIRGTAMILEALSRVDPDNVMAPGAVRWLMTARQASHWPTSHETAWSILALAHWMEASGELEADYSYELLLNGDQAAEGHFDADNVATTVVATTPVNELFLEDVNYLDFRRGAGPGRLYYSAQLDSFVRAEGVQAVDRGIIVQRTYYDANCDPMESACTPISEIQAGQQVRVELTVIAPSDLLYAIVRDPIPAGAEAIDPNLETTPGELQAQFQRVDEETRYYYWGWWFFNRVEFRDNAVQFFSEFLPAGTYRYTYYLQAVIPGEFQVIPATARQEFFPEVFGRSDGFLFSIVE